jgi:predicted nucleic acid-binding protein
MRSPSGASAALLRAARRGLLTPVANVALAIEYEATCMLPEHRLAAGFSEQDVQIFVDALVAMAEPVATHFLWRPRLRDAGDEMVLEASVNGGAKAIVTFNVTDFAPATTEFGIEVVRPGALARRLRAGKDKL